MEPGSPVEPTTNLPPLAAPPPLAKPVVLAARGLHRSFGRVRAVNGIDLNVREGEIYGFLGVNGAGKTTTIRMLMGIIKPDAGVIEMLGQAARRTTMRQKQSIGYVSQEQTFYSWMTGRELGRFVGGFYPTWDAGEFDRLLRVLDVPADRKTSQLSGGTRVKLALALALAPRPALLILDEPTSGLDPVARREFLDIIQRQARDHGRSTFFSSHIVGEVERVADRVGIIHQGKMRFEGDLQSLRDSVREARLPPPLPSHGMEMATTPVAAWRPPGGFTLLGEESKDGEKVMTLEAPPTAWAALDPAVVRVNPIPLEDIFIALARSTIGRL